MNRQIATQALQQKSTATPTASGLLQRKCACGNHTVTDGECAGCSKKKQTLQRASLSGRKGIEGEGETPPIINKALGSPGQPLDLVSRAFFQTRFGHDFSQVRIHTDAIAAESARAVNAQAYAVGRDIVFAAGTYRPDDPDGRRLLAHELTHIRQESQHGAPTEGRQREKLALGDHDASEERLAAAAASNLSGRSDQPVVLGSRSGQGSVIRRAPDPAKPKADLVNAIKINLTSGRVVFQFQSGKTISGTVATDLDPGTYWAVANHREKKWYIPGTKPGLRFDLELDGPDPWTFSYPKKVLLEVAKGTVSDVPLGELLEGDVLPITGDPTTQPNYVEIAVKGVGIPIWGGPFYLYHKAGVPLTNPDAIVLPRTEVRLTDDPLKGKALAIWRVYRTRAEAHAVVAEFGEPGAYAFYVGSGGHIYPTVISDSTAPALCATLRKAVDDEKKGAKAVENLAIDLALWYVGARLGMRRPGSAPSEAAAAGESANLAKTAQSLAEEAAKRGKVVVNLGGTGEVANAINVNPLTAQKVKDIPNLVRAGAEEVGNLFKPGTIDKIVSNDIVRGTVNWPKAAEGSFRALKAGGQVSIAPYVGQLAEQLSEIQAALKAAGFKEVKVIADHFITAVKP